MSKYADEEIIKARNAYKKKSYGDIYNGIFVKEELVEFEKQILFDGKVSIYLPRDFFDMPRHLAEQKYPMAQRPGVIKTNDGTDVNFTFNLIPQKIENDALKLFTERMKQVLQHVQSAAVFYPVCYMDQAGNVSPEFADEKKHKTEEEGKKDRSVLSFFDYKSPSLDEPLYNLMFFVPMKSEVFQGTFNCRFREAEVWKEIFLQVVNSIQIDQEM